MGPTKTRRDRVVDLTPYTMEVLDQLRHETKFYRDGDPVFCTRRGNRLTCDAVRSQHSMIRLRTDVNLQDLRHTYATIRVAKGHNIVDVSEQLGHKDISMTLDVYTHWVPKKHKAEVDELDTLHLIASGRTQSDENRTVMH